MRSGKKLSVETRGRIQPGDSICYNMSNLREQSYQLTIDPENLSGLNTEAWFMDRFTGTQQLLQMDSASTITITINAQPGSKAANRFYILFTPRLVVLPVTFVSANAYRKANREVLVEWKVENEINIRQYEIERSKADMHFTKLAEQVSVFNQSSGSYFFTDVDKESGALFYRVKAISNDGAVQYSRIMKLAATYEVQAEIFPNPSDGKTIHITGKEWPTGQKVQVTITDAAGRVVERQGHTMSSGRSELTITPKQTLAEGYYQLEINGPGFSRSMKLLVTGN
ncbi:MAG: T9SS type A sorting domain-containing protein [Sphingobacteriales bacterium]|nr:MAG: T9SS type A sorting domain-containing protein [Sphingobacteriales bacterium]